MNRKFLFKLCSHLGYKTVAELEQTMSYIELQEWVQYYSEERFQPDRLELQLATLSELIYRTSGGKDLTAMDFMPSLSEEEKEIIRLKNKRKQNFDAFESFGNT